MKGYNGWSYTPYTPFLFEAGDIYICRIVPDIGSIYFEWIAEENQTYSIYKKKLEETGAFEYCGRTKGNSYEIGGLESNEDYQFYVAASGKKSRVRLARTGKCAGTVVNYLHPKDMAYSFSGQYLCSPSLVRFEDGMLLASMDLYVEDGPQNLTLIYRSDDDGKTWHYVSELFPCFWGKMFLHWNELYMLAVSTEYGDLLIGKSTDRGKTFGTPTVLLRGAGNNIQAGVHKNPQNIVYYKGRIYTSLEWGTWKGDYRHAAMVMSCDENADLLEAANWNFTPPVVYDPAWEGVAEGTVLATLEGTLAVNPKGELMNVMRYQTTEESIPKYGLILQYLVDTENPDAPLKYSHATEFPANRSKFMIEYDEETRRYYTIANRILSEKGINHRNLLSLMASYDMEKWEVITDLLDFRNENPEKVGFQYVDFMITGNDIIFLCRTAMNDAANFHNSNYSTFHRIENFRYL